MIRTGTGEEYKDFGMSGTLEQRRSNICSLPTFCSMRLRALLPDRDELHADPGIRNGFLVATVLWLIGWYWSIEAIFARHVVAANLSVDAPLFPGIFSSPHAGVGALVLPAVAVPMLLACRFNPTRPRVIVIAGLFVASSFFCLLHSSTFSSARFLSMSLMAMWIGWVAAHYGRSGPTFGRETRWLAKGMIALLFFGAAVGKWTSGYWSGEILYNRSFAWSEHLFFPWIRSLTTDEQLMTVAVAHSRFVIIAETLFVFTVLLRFRTFVACVVVMATGVCLLSGPGVPAVMIPLVGVALGGLFMPAPEASARRWSRPFLVVAAMPALIGAMTALMVVTPPLQKAWMKQHHTTQENRLVWVVLQFAPKMYSFEHQVPEFRFRDDGETSGDDFIMKPCFRENAEIVGHYPGKYTVDPLCYQHLRDYDQPLTVVLRSRYRSTCLESHLEVKLVDDDSRVQIRPISISDQC